MTDRPPSKAVQGIFPLLYSVFFILLFSSSYPPMLKWWENSDYNYCYIVPLAAGYLFWERRKSLQLPSVPSWAGLAPLILGVLLYLLGNLGAQLYSINLSSWFMLVGLLWLHLGRRKLRAFAFPVCFLVAMFPLPSAINTIITMKLKMISSTIGVHLLQLAGTAVFQEGNIIDLGFTRLEVVEACSGLRYLFPLLLVGILLAAQQRARLWQRALLVATAVPLSILINSLRIAGMVWLYPLLGARVLDGFWHDFLGWLIFMASVAVLLGERRLLLRWSPVAPQAPSRADAGPVRPSPQPQRSVWPMAVLALILLATTLAVTRGDTFREQVPLKQPFLDFPMQIGEWHGTRENLEQVYLDVLHLSDYLLADYADARGRSVNIYVGYYESQSKDQTTHSPDVCLTGSGWVFKESGLVRIPVGPGATLADVNRILIKKDGVQMVGFYWYPQRGRVVTNIFLIKWYIFWDALTRHRTDGALVRLLTTVNPGEQPAQAETRLRDFARLFEPLLDGFLPK